MKNCEPAEFGFWERAMDSNAARVRLVVELGLDLVARAARAPGIFLTVVLRQRIAALDHETLDDAVKTGSVIKTLVRQVL